MTTALIYARQSLAKEGKTASVDRQLEACRRLCSERGYEIVAEHEDRGVSAYDTKATRPGFVALIDDVARGRGEVVVAFHPDRLWRQPLDREAFIGVAAASGLEAIVTVQGGVENVGNVDEGFLGDLGAILARRESATIARRMRARHVSKRAAGEWPGGQAPLGYRLDPARKSLTVVPAEAKLVRSAVKKLLRGESSLTVSRWLTEESGRRWTPSNCLKLLTSPTLAGLRDDGSEALWKPVVSAADHEALVALRASRSTGKRGPKGRYRLSGVMRCGVCAGPMVAQVQLGTPGWRCSLPAGGCGGVSIGDDIATEGLLDQLTRMLDSKRFRKALAKALDAAPEVAAAAEAVVTLRDRLTTLEDALASGDLELDGYRRIAPKVRDELAAAEAVLSRSTGQSAAASLPPTGDALRESWSHLEPTEARALVGLLCERVTIAPRQVPGPRRQPGRVTVVSRW